MDDSLQLRVTVEIPLAAEPLGRLSSNLENPAP